MKLKIILFLKQKWSKIREFRFGPIRVKDLAKELNRSYNLAKKFRKKCHKLSAIGKGFLLAGKKIPEKNS